MRNDRFCYTLDVLTDGSEHTGSGSLFLSVWKVPLAARRVFAEESSSSPDSNANSSRSLIDEDDDRQETRSGNIESDNPYAWLTFSADNDGEVPVPVVRYAISGLGDATARMCADQGFKLNKTRACFLPTLSGERGVADGLSALFYALSASGSPSLHVVVPESFERRDHTFRSGELGAGKPANRSSGAAFLEELVTILFGPRQKFDLLTCEVKPPKDADSNRLIWWKVYEDEYLLAHASSAKGLSSKVPRAYSSSSSLVYLFSFPILKPIGSTQSYYTIALLPPNCRHMESAFVALNNQQLPVIEDGTPIASIDSVIYLDPLVSSLEDSKLKAFMSHPSVNTRVLMTFPHNSHSPNESSGGAIDDGILIRSQVLHRVCFENMPSSFMRPRIATSNSIGVPFIKDHCQLRSGTSIVLEKTKDIEERSWRVCDRREQIRNRMSQLQCRTKESVASLRDFEKSPERTSSQISNIDDNEIDIDDTDIDLEEMTEETNIVDTDGKDENEIDLEEEDSSIEGVASRDTESQSRVAKPARQCEEYSEPIGEKAHASSIGASDGAFRPCSASRGTGARLLVLGTGCATPSAYRGASGYALFLPQYSNDPQASQDMTANSDEIYLLDCGEGVPTMLSRNCGQFTDWRSRIRGIWISHAHMDHYGGLPNLLRLLWRERESKVASNSVRAPGGEPCSKRLKVRNGPSKAFPIPWVIAPSKVLRYLDLILDCRHGRSNIDEGILFEPRVHQDPTKPESCPFFHLQNIKVFHNCCPAFGLLLGWRTNNNPGYLKEGRKNPRKFQYLCYSGDTRPSHNLVRACRTALKRCKSDTGSDSHDLFLIHEATYREEESAMAHQKKHSTVDEARRIARDCGCSRVLLTHFSNRYDGIPKASTDTLTQILHNNSNTKSIAYPLVGFAIDGLWISLENQ